MSVIRQQLPEQQSQARVRVAFVTLGCAKNEVDSDKMRARVLNAGLEVVEDPEAADAIIINTCSFITEATNEAIATILEVADLPGCAEGSGRIIVTGCLPSRYGDELKEGFPEVAAFVGCDGEESIVEVIAEVLAPDDSKLADAEDTGELARGAVVGRAAGGAVEGAVGRAAGGAVGGAAGLAGAGVAGGAVGRAAGGAVGGAAKAVLRTCSAPWVYVKIADGCDRRCAFCTIPAIKGSYRSVPAAEITAEIAALVEGGAREIVLIAQDTGVWGRDLKEGNDSDDLEFAEGTRITDLAALLDHLARRFPTTWLRVMYLQPQGISDALLEVMARHDTICNYFDIPLQHANARILAEMNRSGNGADYLRLIERIRAALPDVALRTTLIAGFPGETRAEARELERFVQAANFDYVGVFPYSQEDGTPAGQRADQVPLKTRKARAQRLRDLADRIGFARVAARLGSTVEVLACELEESEDLDMSVGESSFGLLGRAKWQAPEVDGMIHLDRGDIGTVLSARIVETYCYELDGKVIS